MEIDPEIRRYLDEHGATYTAQALRKALLDAGHDPAAVDAGLREWEAARTSEMSARTEVGRASPHVLTDWSIAFFWLGAVAAAGGALLVVFFSRYLNVNLAVYLASYAVGYVLLGLGLRRLVRWGAGRFNPSGAWTFLIGMLLLPAFGLLMFGSCLAALGLARTI